MGKFLLTLLGLTGLYWAVLGCTGLYWAALGCTGLQRSCEDITSSTEVGVLMPGIGVLMPRPDPRSPICSEKVQSILHIQSPHLYITNKRNQMKAVEFK